MIGEWLTAVINSSMYTFEVSPVFSVYVFFKSLYPPFPLPYPSPPSVHIQFSALSMFSMELYILEKVRNLIGWTVISRCPFCVALFRNSLIPIPFLAFISFSIIYSGTGRRRRLCTGRRALQPSGPPRGAQLCSPAHQERTCSPYAARIHPQIPHEQEHI